MEKFQKILILFLLIALSLPAFYINRWIQLVIMPRRSFKRFLTYMMVCMALVFAYSFLVVWLIRHLFPLSNR